ncbi:MAG: S1/P1 nuclease [Phycisphaerae bacterium]|nr:S1/P1 nuclease [Phycisphaerae bacterium]
MRRPPPRLIAHLVLLALLVAPCLGWGAEGHKIVGTIASAALTEDVAKKVRDLLGEQSIADACCWADEIRSDARYDWVKPLHFINVPRDASKIDLHRDGLDGQQVVSAITKYRDIVKDVSRPKSERAEALRLLLHFVGDIHQPFHVSYKEDRGGNMLSLSAFGEKSNIHRVWDTDLIRRRLRDTKGGWAVMSADLRQAISDDQRRKWTTGLDPEMWANESLTLTRELYANLPTLPNDVDDVYYKRWMPTVNERLEAAGVRLGAMLNEILDAPRAGTKTAASEKADLETANPSKAAPEESVPAGSTPTQLAPPQRR